MFESSPLHVKKITFSSLFGRDQFGIRPRGTKIGKFSNTFVLLDCAQQNAQISIPPFFSIATLCWSTGPSAMKTLHAMQTKFYE